MADKKDLLLFFDRPIEPCFMEKGEQNATFDLPTNFYVSIPIPKLNS